MWLMFRFFIIEGNHQEGTLIVPDVWIPYLFFLAMFAVSILQIWVVATQIFLEFSPRNFGEDEPIFDEYFSDGWVETTN